MKNSHPHVFISSAVESHEVAADLMERLSPRLKAYFGDSCDWKKQLLGTNDFLIVLCSKGAVDSLGVSQAVRAFQDRGLDDNILAVVIEGTDGAHEDQLPMLLRFSRGRDGLLAPNSAHQNFASIDEDGLDGVARKILVYAGVTDSGSEDVPTARHSKPFWKQPAFAGALAATLLVALGLTWSISDLRREIDETQLARHEAEQFSGRLLAQLADTLPRDTRDIVFANLADEIVGRFDLFDVAQMSDEDIARNARLLHTIGNVRADEGDFEGAAHAFDLAASATGALLEREPDDAQRIFDHAQSVFWVGNTAFVRGRFDEAEIGFRSYGQFAQILYDIDPENPVYQAEQGFGLLNVAIVDHQRDRNGMALERMDQALSMFTPSVLAARVATPLDVSNIQAWRADTFRAMGRLSEAGEAREAEISILLSLLDESPDSRAVNVAYGAALRQRAAIHVELGELDLAQDVLDQASDVLGSVIETNPDTASVRRHYMATMRDRAELAMWAGNLTRAKFLIDGARRYRSEGQAGQANDERDMDNASFDLVSARISLAWDALDSALSDVSRSVVEFERSSVRDPGFRRHFAAYALLIQGEVLAVLGREEEAARSYRQARTHIDAMAEPRDLRASAIMSQVLWRLGEENQAIQLRDELLAAGYARPDFMAFWAEPDAPHIAQNAQSTQSQAQVEEAENDG